MKGIFIVPVLICLMLLIGCTQQTPPANNPPAGNQTPPSNQTQLTKENACTDSGGTVTTMLCCGSVGDFPDTCLIGACGCSPDNSHQVKACNCGEGKCWDDSKSRCVTQEMPSQPENETPSEPNLVDMSQIYKFDSVHSYTYEISTTAGGQMTKMNMSTSITADTVNGTAAWLEQTDMTVQGMGVTSKTWIDKVTYKCLETMTVMNYGGQVIEQPGQCPTEGPNSAERTGTTTPQLTPLGIESVTVPAGTFTAAKYSLENVTYWSATSVPVPLKIAYADGLVTMELVSYT